MPNPTLYDNFSRVKDWAVEKFADKETLANTLSDVAFSGDYNDLENTPDLSGYVTDTELDSMSYASKSYVVSYVTDAISNIPGVDLSSYVTKADLSAQSYVTSAALESMAYATTTYVMDKVNAIIDGAPAALDTLNELAAAINDDANFASTVTTALGNKANASDVYTKTEIGNMSYVSQSSLSSMGYISAIPAEYITESELSGMSYVSQTSLSGMAYVTALSQNEMDTLFPITNS